MGDTPPYRTISVKTDVYDTEFEPIRKELEKKTGLYVSMPEAVKLAMRKMSDDWEAE